MKSYPPRTRRATGFTLIEVMVVIAIVAILSLMALPSYLYRTVSDQIASINPLLAVAQAPVTASWTLTQTLPADNAAAGLPLPEKMVGNYVSAVQIQNGVINITFSNRAARALSGKTLSYRPAVVDDAPVVPITWVCGNARAPDKMTAKGNNQTNIETSYLPRSCR